MADQTLVTLANDVRGKTLRLLDGLTDEQSRFAAPGLNNSILWHAGHALILAEHLCIEPLMSGKAAVDPPGYFETFSWKSDPRKVTHWPPLEEVKTKLREQLPRLVALINAADEQLLSRTFDARGRTFRGAIVHGLHDEACHQGEIWLLRKMLGKR